MAVQMSVAYSRVFKGTAIYAGLPYYCAQGSEETALTTCEEDAPTAINLPTLESITRNYAAQHLIDPLSYLKRQRIYLWSGTLDVTVRPPAMDLWSKGTTDPARVPSFLGLSLPKNWDSQTCSES